MKKVLLWLLSIVMLVSVAFGAVACAPKENEGEGGGGIIDIGTKEDEVSVKLDSSSLSLVIGDVQKLTATTAGEGTLSFESSNSSVASVDSEGVVTALKTGSATVTASFGGKTATCTISVGLDSLLPAIAFNGEDKAEYTLNVGDDFTFEPFVRLGEKKFNDASFSFESNDKTVADFDEEVNGKLVAKKKGETSITISASWRDMTADDYETLRVTYDVSVTDSVIFTINGEAAKNIELSTVASVDGFDGSWNVNTDFVPSVSVNNVAEMPDVAIGDNTVVAIESGKLVAKKAGTTTITLSIDVDGTLYSDPAITVTVVKPVVEVTKKVEYFSAVQGGYKAETDNWTVKTLADADTRLSGVNFVSATQKLTSGEKNLTVNQNKIMGLDINLNSVTNAQITAYTDTVGYKFTDVEVYGDVLATADDMKQFDASKKNTPVLGYFVMVKDIDMGGYRYETGTKVGNYTNGIHVEGNESPASNYFQGTFDGQGHTVSNFATVYANGGRLDTVFGIFGFIYDGSTVKNVRFNANSAYGGRVLAIGLGDNVTIENISVNIANLGNDPVCGIIAVGVGSSLTINNVVINAHANAAYDGSNALRGSLFGGGGGKWPGTVGGVTNVYVNVNYPITVGYDTKGIGYAANETDDDWNYSGSTDKPKVRFPGVKRYDDANAMALDGSNDFTSFDNELWHIENGVPVWGKGTSAYSVIVNGKVANGAVEANVNEPLTVRLRQFGNIADFTLETSDATAVTADNTAKTITLLDAAKTATVTVKVGGNSIGTFTVEVAREKVTVTEDVDFSVFDGKVVSTQESTWFGSDDYTITAATLNGTPLTVTAGKIEGIAANWNYSAAGKAFDGTTTVNCVAPSDVNKLTGELVITTATHSVTFKSVKAYDGVIVTPQQFKAIFDIDADNKINSGFYVLGADIDMTGVTLAHSKMENMDTAFKQMGSSGTFSFVKDTTGFCGIFDGRGHSISNFTADRGGLFGKFYRTDTWSKVHNLAPFYTVATVRNVAITDVNVSVGPAVAYRSHNLSAQFYDPDNMALLENVYVSYSEDCSALKGLFMQFRTTVKMDKVVVDASKISSNITTPKNYVGKVTEESQTQANATLFGGTVGMIKFKANEKAVVDSFVNNVSRNVFIIAPDALLPGSSAASGENDSVNYNYGGTVFAMNKASDTLLSYADPTLDNCRTDLANGSVIYRGTFQYNDLAAMKADTDNFNASAFNSEFWNGLLN